MSNRIQTLALVVLGAPVLVFGLAATTAHADTIHVCWDGSGDYLTIQEGIDAASDGDEVIVCDGTYAGAGNKNLDFGGKAITLRSASGDPALCIIDCEGDGRGFYFHHGETAASIVDGFTITNGHEDHSGGIYCRSGSSPTISNCVIVGNMADEALGGGVSCEDSDPTITNCAISGNWAYFGGGGVYCVYNSSPTITNCTISGNWGGYGGGVYCSYYSGPTLTNCTISCNWAVLGSGVCSDDYSSPTLTNCIVWGNLGPTGEEIYEDDGSTTSVTYSDVWGGWPGYGNIDADPLFVDPDGPDDDPNTWEDNDYHLSAGSPCIDGGCNWCVPRDMADLDEDGDTDESTPFDLDGEGRFFDDPDTDDTGCGCPPRVDMGAYEFGGTGPQPCPGDLDCDRVVGHGDLGILLGDWGCNGGDMDCSGHTDQADLGILLAHWGEGCP